MASINDIGVPGQPLSTPPLTSWQAAVRDHLNASSTWTQFTPGQSSWTAQTSNCRYMKTPGRLVAISCVITVATVGTNPLIGLPAGIQSATEQPINLMMFDSGNTYFPGLATVSGPWIVLTTFPTTAGGGVRGITATAPFTWAAGDQFLINGTYQAA